MAQSTATVLDLYYEKTRDIPPDTPDLEFHRERQTGVGGSDLGPICGIPTPTGGSEVDLRRGRLLEPIAADRWMEEHPGRKLRRYPTQRLPDEPCTMAHVDRKVEGENTGVEIKAPRSWTMRSQIRDGVRQANVLQGQWYMGICGWETMDFGLISMEHDPDWVSFPMEFDRELFGLVLGRARKFWGYVEERMPPPLEEFPPLEGLPRILLAPHLDEAKVPPVKLSMETLAEVRAEALMKEASELAGTKSEAEKRGKAVRAELGRLMDHMGHQGIEAPFGTAYHRRQQSAPRVDAKLLKMARPIDRDALVRWLAERAVDSDEGFARALQALQRAAVAGVLDLDVEGFIKRTSYKSVRVFPRKQEEETDDE